MKNILLIIVIILLNTLISCTDLGETFDVLMGKYTNPRFEDCVTNKSPDAWFIDSKYAYYLARSLFEKYSVEKEHDQADLKVPKIIHQIWLGGLVPEKYAAWIATWHKHHPDWTIIMWMDHDITNLNLVNKDLFARAQNYGEKSDILRAELIDMFGGLYVDTDYECLQPFDKFNFCNSFYISAVGMGHCGVGINNALIGASLGHPLIKKIVYSMQAVKHLGELSERTGPMYVTRIFFTHAEQFQKDAVMYPVQYFSPCDQKSASVEKSCYAIHWFDASWGRAHTAAKKILHDPTLEIGLTPLFFNKKSKNGQSGYSLDLCGTDWGELFEKLNHRSIIEVGACNFVVDSRIDLKDLNYTGISPVKFLALEQRLLYNNQANRVYWWQNWLQEEISQCGLLILGDTLEYLPYEHSVKLLQKMVTSNAEFYMIAHDASLDNSDIKLGQSRTLNVCKEPFNLPQPYKFITIDKKTYGIWNNDNLKAILK